MKFGHAWFHIDQDMNFFLTLSFERRPSGSKYKRNESKGRNKKQDKGAIPVGTVPKTAIRKIKEREKSPGA